MADDTDLHSRLGLLDINERDECGLTPLSLATTSGQTEKVKELLMQGADPNIANGIGMTPLHFVAGFDNTEIVQLLLEHGAVVNRRTQSGTTPLQSAALQGNKDLIRLLVRHGADPNEKDNEGIAVIDLAKDDATRQVLKEAIHYAASEKCEFCGNSEIDPTVTLKRCANCKMVLYCSKACQKKDWKKGHKEKCDEFTMAYPGCPDFPNGATMLKSNQDFSVRMVTVEQVQAALNLTGTEKFIVKVQVPFFASNSALFVYNEDRSIVVYVTHDTQGYSRLRKKVIEEGCPVKVKAFFWAKKSSDPNGSAYVKIFYSRLAPFQSW